MCTSYNHWKNHIFRQSMVNKGMAIMQIQVSTFPTDEFLQIQSSFSFWETPLQIDISLINVNFS